MTTLYIAEKPSQASDIAKVIGIASRQDGYIELKTGDQITWAFGHLLEQAAPDEYKEEWKRWSWEYLPMIPEVWKLNITKSGSKQFKIVSGLIKKASAVVIASDAGREGEMIAREMLDYCRFKGSIKRLWLSALTTSEIKKGLAALKDGSETEPLYQAALARSRADWMYGMNMSRAVTLATKKGQSFPIGRVQTPTLAMVVKRDLEIENFVSKEYFELEALLKTKNGHDLTLYHVPSEENRIYTKSVAEDLLKKAEGASGPLKVTKSKGKESPPLPFTLPALQKVAEKALGFTAAKTLSVAQSLYEQKAITYPRTGCPYLSASQKPEMNDIVENVSAKYPDPVSDLKKQGIVLRDSLFDDSKLTDHHGIIPTQENISLSGDDLGLYKLIAIRFLQALGQDMLYDGMKIEFDANGVPFKATGKTITFEGWQSIK